MLQIVAVLFGLIAVASSICVATFVDEHNTVQIKILGAISAISISVMTSFQMPKKLRDLWTGWKFLNASIIRFEGGLIGLAALVDAYAQAEAMVGTMEVDLHGQDSKGENGKPAQPGSAKG
ncbi:MAG: hypothetical protein JO133_10635 [Burkholderiaceae bacterium]|nr:hypothetical protein [Burkholderiaceae bacterium]